MKKELVIIFLLTIALTPLAIPQEPENLPSGDQLKNITGDIKDRIKNDFFVNSSFQDKIDIPDFLEIPVEVVFGIPRGEDVGVERLIVIVALFIGFLVLIYSIFEFMPFFEGKFLKFLGALIVTTLITMTGAAFYLIETLFHFINFFDWIDKLGKWKIAVSIILIGAIFLGLKVVMNYLKGKVEKEKSNATSENLRVMAKAAKYTKESMIE